MKQIPIILCYSGLGLAKLMTSSLVSSLGNSLACVSKEKEMPFIAKETDLYILSFSIFFF